MVCVPSGMLAEGCNTAYERDMHGLYRESVRGMLPNAYVTTLRTSACDFSVVIPRTCCKLAGTEGPPCMSDQSAELRPGLRRR